jgi:hypothetical protein
LSNASTAAAQPPPTPPVDPDNAEFVIFVRAKKFPQWFPLSVVKGGSAANVLVKAMESELGRKLSGNTLVRNIGTVRWQGHQNACVALQQRRMAARRLSCNGFAG